MKSSNLAERLEEFEAVIDSLRLSSERVTRVVATQPYVDNPAPKRRVRTRSVGGIVIRDQGLQTFRVR